MDCLPFGEVHLETVCILITFLHPERASRRAEWALMNVSDSRLSSPPLCGPPDAADRCMEKVAENEPPDGWEAGEGRGVCTLHA